MQHGGGYQSSCAPLDELWPRADFSAAQDEGMKLNRTRVERKIPRGAPRAHKRTPSRLSTDRHAFQSFH